ncbi:MAG: hypothetical protein WC654_00130 [Patescibacteria group bacterium]
MPHISELQKEWMALQAQRDIESMASDTHSIRDMLTKERVQIGEDHELVGGGETPVFELDLTGVEYGLADVREAVEGVEVAVGNLTHEVVSGFSLVCRNQVQIGRGLKAIHKTQLDTLDTLDDIHDELEVQTATLEDIGDGVWAIHDLLDEVGWRVCDRIVKQTKTLHRDMIGVQNRIEEQTEVLHQDLASVATGIDRQTRIVHANLVSLRQSLDRQTSQMTGLLVALDERLETKVQELTQAVKSELGNRAEERYQEAVRQFATGHVGLTLEVISKLFEDDGTHPRAWVLFGRCCYQRMQISAATKAFVRAVKYALVCGDQDAYQSAAIRLSRLLRATGQRDHAQHSLDVAYRRTSDDWKKKSLWELKYEQAKYRWEDLQSSPFDRALVDQVEQLADSIIACAKRLPDARREIASDPFWKSLRDVMPWVPFPENAHVGLWRIVARMRILDEDLPGWNPQPKSGVILAVRSLRDFLWEILPHTEDKKPASWSTPPNLLPTLTECQKLYQMINTWAIDQAWPGRKRASFYLLWQIHATLLCLSANYRFRERDDGRSRSVCAIKAHANNWTWKECCLWAVLMGVDPQPLGAELDKQLEITFRGA